MQDLFLTVFQRTSEFGATQEIKISVVARSNDVIKRLVLEAKKLYETDAEHRIHIYVADQYGYWRYSGSRQKRALSSIVLEPGVKDMIVADCKDFLRSEDVSSIVPDSQVCLRVYSGMPSAECELQGLYSSEAHQVLQSISSWIPLAVSSVVSLKTFADHI